MYRLKKADLVKSRFIALWSVLAFQAGFINSIGFLACQRFVSHVTGFGTQVGIALGVQNFWLAIEVASAPLSFLLGALTCGLLSIARRARGLAPRYNIATATIPLLLFVLLIGGNLNLFGTFGQPMVFEEDFIFLSILSFMCGMQNAIFATLTGGQIRTTHLTGIITDFGTDLALIINGGLPPFELSALKRMNFTRAMIFGSFSIGALVSSLVSARLQYWSLMIPFLTALFVTVIFFVIKYEFDNSDPYSSNVLNKVPERTKSSSPVQV